MKIAISILVVVVLVAGGVFVISSRIKASKTSNKTQYKIGKAEVGTVKKTVSATGTIQPWTIVEIKSKAGGRVDELKVDVGSEVRKGQVLAKIDPSDTQLSVNQAQADIDSADAKITQTKETYGLQIKQSNLSVQTAQSNLGSAIASREAAVARLKTAELQKDAQPELTQASIAAAKANLDSAQKQLNQLVEATNPQESASAQSAYDQAIANEKNAKADIVRQKALLAKGFVSQQVVDQAQASYDVAHAQVDSAKKKLDTIGKEQEAAIATAKAKVSQAKAQYDSAKATEVDVKTKESSYAEAVAAVRQADEAITNSKKQLQLAKANMANNGIRQSDILQAEAVRKRAEANLVNAKNTLDQTTVTATCDGVVLTKSVEEGTIIASALSFAATGNTILTIGDTSKLYVDVTVDETDIANVSNNQEVEVTVEAYPSMQYEGRVIRIDPQAVVESNVTTVHVRVQVDHENPAFLKLLKPGMNATCEFVKDKKDNVLYVPNEAIRTDDQGTFVEIARGGTLAPPDPKTGAPADKDMVVDAKIEHVVVETGIEGNENTEIVKGNLKKDDPIVISKIEAAQQTPGSPLGGGGPRGR